MSTCKVPGHIAFEIDAKAEEKPDFQVITFENDEYPEEILIYQDIVLNGRKIAASLLKSGIGRGDAFALVMRNHPEFIYSLYAATLIGAIMLPIDPRTKGDRLAYLLNDSKSKGIIFTSEFMGNVEAVFGSIPELKTVGVVYKEGFNVPVSNKYPSLNEILSGPEVPPPDKICDDLNVPIEVIYTSGTTGDPKGVVIKGSRLAPFALIAQLVWQYTQEDKLYTGLSLTHGNAQGVTMMPSLLLGIPSVFSQKFTKKRLWDICRQYGCTSFSLLGGMMMGIFSEPPRENDADNSVRLVLSAGTPKMIWETFEKRFGVMIHEWYGAVEGGFAHKPPGIGPVGSFGKPLDGVLEMKIVKEDDSECETGEVGEIIARAVSQPTEVEYLGKKNASEKKTRGGWLRSGDMGHVDENGWFYFDYRKGGGLRRSGDFIQPEHIEAVIAEHPDVCDLCAYGVPAASGAPGESDIVVAVAAFENRQIDVKSVYQHCFSRLDGNSVPSYLQVVELIPKTASEKNLDRLLREEFKQDSDNVHQAKDYR